MASLTEWNVTEASLPMSKPAYAKASAKVSGYPQPASYWRSRSYRHCEERGEGCEESDVAIPYLKRISKRL